MNIRSLSSHVRQQALGLLEHQLRQHVVLSDTAYASCFFRTRRFLGTTRIVAEGLVLQARVSDRYPDFRAAAFSHLGRARAHVPVIVSTPRQLSPFIVGLYGITRRLILFTIFNPTNPSHCRTALKERGLTIRASLEGLLTIDGNLTPPDDDDTSPPPAVPAYLVH